MERKKVDFLFHVIELKWKERKRENVVLSSQEEKKKKKRHNYMYAFLNVFIFITKVQMSKRLINTEGYIGYCILNSYYGPFFY